MTMRFLTAVALLFATLFGVSNAIAQSPFSFEHEMLFVRLHTAHGTSTDNVFGLDAAQRFALSVANSNNVGARITFFDYDHEGSFVAPGGTRRISLDMQNTDFELFKRLNLTCKTGIEASAGLRYSDNDIFFPTPFEPNDFTGFGGFLGLRGTTSVFTGGELYARGKMAILGGKGVHDGNGINTPVRFEQSRTHTEIAFGYQHAFQLRRLVVTPHFGTEWMNFSDYVVDPVDEQPESDMMLGGLAFGVNLGF